MKADVIRYSHRGDSSSNRIPPDSHTGPPHAEGQTLLVVEDHPTSRELFRIILESHGYSVDFCENAECGLSTAEKGHYDAFLIDINLGHGPNGFDLLEQLRRMESCRTTPAIAVTAYALPGDRLRCLEMGFDAYVSKPFRHEMLLKTIRDSLVHTAS